MGWREFVGDAGRIVGLNHYGASAAYTVLYEEFGLTERGRRRRRAGEHRRRRVAAPPSRAGPGAAPAASPTPPATAEPTPPRTRRPQRGLDSRKAPVMAQNENLAELSAAGVSVWLDDLSRDRIRSGNLQSLVDEYSVVGVTTNPTIFAAAISGSDSYDDQLHALAVRSVSVEEALRTITAADVRDACDLLRPGPRPAARRRPGLPRGGPRPGARHRRHRRRGRATCGGWSTGRTCSSRSRRPRPACRRSPRPSRTGSVSTSP